MVKPQVECVDSHLHCRSKISTEEKWRKQTWHFGLEVPHVPPICFTPALAPRHGHQPGLTRGSVPLEDMWKWLADGKDGKMGYEKVLDKISERLVMMYSKISTNVNVAFDQNCEFLKRPSDSSVEIKDLSATPLRTSRSEASLLLWLTA